MKNIFILLSFSLFVFSSCGQKKIRLLNSKESIFKHLQKKNTNLSIDDVCIEECTLLNDLFVVGYFAHDRGCGDPIYFFKGKKIKMKNKTIKEILINSGFEKDNTNTVENYHSEITNHYQHILTVAPEEFDTKNHTFTPPTTRILKGMIISIMWIQEQSGMIPQVVFHRSTVIFELDGTFLEHIKDEHFAVDL